MPAIGSITKPPLWMPGIQRAHPLANGLIGCWALNEGRGLYAANAAGSEKGSLAVAVSPLPSWVASAMGPAVKLVAASSQYITMGDVLDNRLVVPCSVVIWATITTTTGTLGLFESDANGANYQGVLVFSNAGKVTIRLGNNTGTGATGRRDRAGNTTLPTNTVFQAAGVWRNASGDDSVYLNGVDDSGSGSGSATTLVHTSSNMRLGSYRAGSYLDGLMVAAFVYNRALSADDVKSLYLDPWQFLRPPVWDWGFTAKAAATTFTAAGAPTIGHATAAASAMFTKPTYTGTGAATIGRATAAASAAFTPPTFAASAAAAVGRALAAASATFTKPTYTGSGAGSVAHPLASAAATFTKPSYTGSIAADIGRASGLAAAIFTPPTFAAMIDGACGHAVVVALASFTVTHGGGWRGVIGSGVIGSGVIRSHRGVMA